ncbi:putative methyl-CpG-binding domain protein 3-like 3 [Thomomys bottae]
MKRSILPDTLRRKKKAGLLSRGQQKTKLACTTLPVRMTNCIFKKSVTKILSHPGSKVRHRGKEQMLGNLGKSQQSGLRRLHGLQVYSSDGQLLFPFEIVNSLLFESWGSPHHKPQGQTGIDNRPIHPMPSNQPPHQRVPVPNESPTWLPLFKQATIQDIQRQTEKVKQARKRLAEALKANSLAREIEKIREEGDLK